MFDVARGTPADAILNRDLLWTLMVLAEYQAHADGRIIIDDCRGHNIIDQQRETRSGLARLRHEIV